MLQTFSGARTSVASCHVFGRRRQAFICTDKCCKYSCARTNAAIFHVLEQLVPARKIADEEEGTAKCAFSRFLLKMIFEGGVSENSGGVSGL